MTVPEIIVSCEIAENETKNINKKVKFLMLKVCWANVIIHVEIFSIYIIIIRKLTIIVN